MEGDILLPRFRVGDVVVYGVARERARIKKINDRPSRHTPTYRIQFWRHAMWTKEDYWASEEGLTLVERRNG